MSNKQDSKDQEQNKQTIQPPKNPDIVHLNGRVLLRSVQRNTLFCAALSAVMIVITFMVCDAIAWSAFIGLVVCSLLVPLFLLAYLIKICFVDGAMGALIIRGNKNQPITL